MAIFLKEGKLLYRGRIPEKGHQETGVFLKEAYLKMMENVSSVINLVISLGFVHNRKKNKDPQYTAGTKTILVKNHVKERSTKRKIV